MFDFIGPAAKRKRLSRAAPAGVLKAFLEEKLPDRDAPIEDLDFLAVDFETTGLDSNRDQLLSIGFVQISKLEIDLSTATHYLIRGGHELPEDTVVIHKITHDQRDEGIEMEAAVSGFLEQLQGKIMIAHHARIESGFTHRVCKQLYGCGIIIPVLDTLRIEADRLPASQHGQNNLNLNMCCQRYNLPRYRLHDALSDALSCAELLLAQISYGQSTGRDSLTRFLQYLP